MNGAHAEPASTTRTGRRSRTGAEIALAARSDASILLTGEPAPACRFAYRLHLASGWRHGAFTVVDCGRGDDALEASLFDALFDDDLPTPGIVHLRLVQAGSVLLQEVNRLPLGIQRRLAARLSEQTSALRAGRSRRRLVASTSEPLFERVLAGTFDDSLYYRLNVMHFDVPSSD